MTQMHVRFTPDAMVKLSELKSHPKNRNKHPAEQITRLAEILNYQGWRYPVKVSKRSGLVTSGHGRIEAAKLNGWTQAPVSFQDYDSDEQEYADVQADNAIASWAELDLSGINSDVSDLGPDFDIDMLGIRDFVLEPAEMVPMADDDDVPEFVEPRSKLGDVYSLGNHRLVCGDSTSIDAVGALMNGAKAALVFTDPPYGVDYDGGHAVKGVRREKLKNDDSANIYAEVLPLLSAFSVDKAALYLWFSDSKSLAVTQAVTQAVTEAGYEVRSTLIWNKNVAQFGAIGAQYKSKHEPCLYAYKKGHSPFWDGPTNEVSVWDEKRAAKNEFHPTQKPVELSKRAITNSCPKGGVVLDLFGGSGSTLIGCEATGRAARLMELDPHYCDVIVTRWENYTGKKAVLLNG